MPLTEAEELELLELEAKVKSAKAPAEEKPRTLFGLSEGAEQAIFPTTGATSIGKRATDPDLPLGEALALGLSQGGEALATPVRALGMLRKNPETGERFKISDPESNIFRPEMEKIKSKFKAPEDSGELRLDPMTMAIAKSPGLDEKKKGVDPAGAAIEFAGGMAGDPWLIKSVFTNIGKLALKPFTKKLQKAAVEIEQNLLRPRPSKLTKQGIDVENVLKRDMGGSLDASIKKMEGGFKEAESNIHEILDSKIKKAIDDPVAADAATVDVNAAIDRVRKRVSGVKDPATKEIIEPPDKLFFGMKKEAEKALDDWAEEFGDFQMTGLQDIKTANDIKRLLGKKGFKSGTAPTPETVPKELVSDILYLEIMDDIAGKAPELAEHNKLFQELLPIYHEAKYRDLLSQGFDPLSLKGSIFGAAQMSRGGVEGLVKGGAAMAATKALEKGRGDIAQGLYNITKMRAPKTPASGMAAGISRVYNPEAEEENERRKEDIARAMGTALTRR